MDRKKIAEEFSERLILQMKKMGHGRPKSKMGIDLSWLSNACGCSYQMARLYALGKALPDIQTVVTLSQSLEIAPGNLLFGDASPDVPALKNRRDTIEIDPDILKYILIHAGSIFTLSANSNETATFIAEAIYDASHLNTDKNTVYKIIDMMMGSAKLVINNPSMDGKNCA